MQNPVCSVIVPCYNAACYLAASLDSVLKQTFKHFEIVVVNDGSIDNTDDVIKPYLHDSRIKYIKQDNAGPAQARNTGVRNSASEYIAFLDADDLWDATKLEKQMQLFSDPAVGVVYTTARYIDEQGQAVLCQHQSKYLMPRAGKVTPYLFIDNFVPFSSVVVKRECFDKAGFFDVSLRSAEDWELLLRFSTYYEFRYIDEPLLLYRFHSGQSSKDVSSMMLCVDRVRDKFLQHNKGILSRRIIQQAVVNSYIQASNYYRSIDTRKALSYSAKALKAAPADPGTIKNFLKTWFIAMNRMRK